MLRLPLAGRRHIALDADLEQLGLGVPRRRDHRHRRLERRIETARRRIVVREVVDHLFEPHRLGLRQIAVLEQAAHIGIGRRIDIDRERRHRLGTRHLQPVLVELLKAVAHRLQRNGAGRHDAAQLRRIGGRRRHHRKIGKAILLLHRRGDRPLGLGPAAIDRRRHRCRLLRHDRTGRRELAQPGLCVVDRLGRLRLQQCRRGRGICLVLGDRNIIGGHRHIGRTVGAVRGGGIELRSKREQHQRRNRGAERHAEAGANFPAAQPAGLDRRAARCCSLRFVECHQRGVERELFRLGRRLRRLVALQHRKGVVVHVVCHHKSPLRVFLASCMCQETVASLHPMMLAASAWFMSSA